MPELSKARDALRAQFFAPDLAGGFLSRARCV